MLLFLRHFCLKESSKAVFAAYSVFMAGVLDPGWNITTLVRIQKFFNKIVLKLCINSKK